MDKLAPFIPVTLFVLFFVVFTILSLRNVKKTIGNKTSAFSKTAEELKLSLGGGDKIFPNIKWLSWMRRPFNVEGMLLGHHTYIYGFTKGSGKNSRAYWAINVGLDKSITSDMDTRMSISAVGWLSNIGINLGRKPLKTGDIKFDETFSVKARDETLAQGVLLPEVREELLRIWDELDTKGTLHVKEDMIRYEEPGSLRTDTQVRRAAALSRIMCTLASAIDAARSI